MGFLSRAFVAFVLCSVLGEWENVAAMNSQSTIHVVPSPTVSKNGSSTSTAIQNTTMTHNMTATPQNMTVTPSHNKTVTPSHNMTVTPSHNKTVTPSHNMTVTPHNKTVTPSHNMTVTPSHNKTVTPSHNMTVTPSHNATVTPSHNMTVTPSHNMTVMPHSTVMPPHNKTISPSSAHTVMPTSSVHPTPAPQRGNFTVKENGTVCLLANMAAKFDVTIASKKLSLDLPTDATPKGECEKSADEPYITLNWKTNDGHSCNFTMHFVKEAEGLTASSTQQRWAAANLTFSLEMKSGVAEFIYTFHSERGPLNELSADVGYAYECTTAPTHFILTANNSNVDVTLTNIDFQPFDVKDGHLGNVEKCSAPTPSPTARPNTTYPPTKKPESHVVAIAVGCSLGALVIIVGIGYMIGRRRSRNQQAGYRKL